MVFPGFSAAFLPGRLPRRLGRATLPPAPHLPPQAGQPLWHQQHLRGERHHGDDGHLRPAGRPGHRAVALECHRATGEVQEPGGVPAAGRGAGELHGNGASESTKGA